MKGNGRGSKQAESQSSPKMSDATYHLIKLFQSLLSIFFQSAYTPGGKVYLAPSTDKKGQQRIPLFFARELHHRHITIKHRIALGVYILQNNSTYIIQLRFEHLSFKKK